VIENSGEFIFFIVFVFNSQNAYVEYKEIQAAQGVKIAAKELEKAIAGEVMVFRNGTDNALKFQVARIRMFYYFFAYSYCVRNRTVAYTLVHMHIIICYYHTMCHHFTCLTSLCAMYVTQTNPALHGGYIS